MSIQQIVVPVGMAALAIFAMCVALGAAWLAGRQRAAALFGEPGGGLATLRPASVDGRAPDMQASLDGGWSLDRVLVDRVVRVVALLFIAAVGVVVAVGGGTWGDREAAVYLLLAAGTLFVVFMQDLLPSGLQGRSRYWVESIGAIAFLTVLVGLTDGLASPFFVGFFLLIGGASLAGDGLGPIALALGAALSYALVGLLVGGDAAFAVTEVAWIAFNVAALLLLAYVGTVAGRAQRRARDAAFRLSRFDPLTGLYNRAAFFAAMEREIRRVERTGRGFCALMLDLDDLKPVNDTFGHPAGDQLLRSITEVVKRTVRATDTAGRYGGDEFVVLLPETDAEGAFVVAEKLRRDVSSLAIRVQDRNVRTSVSMGLVAYPDDGQTIEALLSAVDAAMYEAKRRGKNQIVGYTTRTERVATSIGPHRHPSARPAQPRPGESRAAQIGVPGRDSVRDETIQPIATPPYTPVEPQVEADQPVDDEPPATPGPGLDPSAGAHRMKTPAAPVEGLLDAEAPAFPVPPVSSPSGPPFPRLPSMPSMPPQPPQPLREDPPVAPDPTRVTAPVWPRDAVAVGRPPVPPVSAAPWQTRGPAPRADAPRTDAMASRDPRRPADRQYIAFPIEPDDSGR